MSHSREEKDLDLLDQLYNKRDLLNQENNDIIIKGLKLQEQALKSSNANSQPFTDELAKVSQQFKESGVEEKLTKVREEIKALETKIYGKPLSNSPHVRRKKM